MDYSTEPPTPIPPILPIKITGDDLNLINYELEKFVEAEETEISIDSPERTCQADIITLTEGNMQMVACPLKCNVFELERDSEVKKTSTSLEELFKRNIAVDDDPPKQKCEEASDGNATHSMKRFHPTSSSCTAAAFDNASAAASKPIKQKLAKNFLKENHKVCPEEMIEKWVFTVSTSKKKNNNNNISSEDDHHIGNHKFDQTASEKCKTKTVRLYQTVICKGTSPENAGHWIKTDPDYLILEL